MLAGAHVFVAQADADVVIPSDLLQRTWTYLHVDSGAEVTSHRDAGGHGLSPQALDGLNEWLTTRLQEMR